MAPAMMTTVWEPGRTVAYYLNFAYFAESSHQIWGGQMLNLLSVWGCHAKGTRESHADHSSRHIL